MSIHERSQEKLEEQHTMRQFADQYPRFDGEQSYKINEAFYTIQGEGTNAGRAALFLRFSNCNLSCAWCDTEYDSGVKLSIRALEKLITHVLGDIAKREPGLKPIIVCTGGEPSLQMSPHFTYNMTVAGYELTMETNGIAWKESMLDFSTITASPKTARGWWTGRGSAGPYNRWREDRLDLKLVWDPANPEWEEILHEFRRAICRNRYVQPLEDQVSRETNVREVLRFVKENPEIRLSLQTHKYLEIR